MILGKAAAQFSAAPSHNLRRRIFFFAGAMIFVVVEELIPESQSNHHHIAMVTMATMAGFTVMMILDVGLG